MSPSKSSVLDRLISDEDFQGKIRKDRIYTWRLRKMGCPFLRLGTGRGSIFYDLTELEEWLASKKNLPCPKSKTRRSPSTARSTR
jgi:hypothetical protein